jgi:CDP-glucose 4,6-dehydratase
MQQRGLIQANVWRGRRVFLTGHTGFKGGWLSLWLIELGARLTGYALAPPTSPSLFEQAGIAACMTGLTGDVRDLDRLERAMAAAAPELVIHMAARSLVRPSHADPLATYATNVMGTAHVLDAVRRCASVRAVLIVTSDKCYAADARAHDETDPMGGDDPYSSSKGCAELVTSAYRRSFFDPRRYARHGVAVASARAGNVIGGGDWAPDRLIPDAMRAFLAGTMLEVRNPAAVRPWQHVLDALHGYLLLCEQLLGADAADFASGWNFGPGAEGERSVAQVLAMLRQVWGPQAAWREAVDAAHPAEVGCLRLDSAKARDRLHWRPRCTLQQALALTAAWYRALRPQQAPADLRAFSRRQINDFMRGADAPARDTAA